MLPTLEERGVASTNLLHAFSDYVKNPCSSKIDVLEEAIFLYDAIQAGCTQEQANDEYRRFRAREGTISDRMAHAGIING